MAAPALEMRYRVDAVQETASFGLAVSETELRGGSSHHSPFVEEAPRLAVPRRGHVLSTAADFYGNPIRNAIATLGGCLHRKPLVNVAQYLNPLSGPDFGSEIDRSTADIAARFVVAIWIAGVAAKGIPVSASLQDAQRWFFGTTPTANLTSLLSRDAIVTAEKHLRANANPTAYLELLPYILDPHGPGSRLSVRRDPSTRSVRAQKRADGVFYTPADVAEYMVGACLDALDEDQPLSLFDPACGTGVFLRAAFQELRRRVGGTDLLSLASECLFGADIDPWALNATSFVLLADVLVDATDLGLPPVATWQRLRSNFARIDTLRIDPAEERLADGEHRDKCRVPINRIFPALQGGPSVILGNPPYADLGRRSDYPELGRAFQTIAVKQKPGAEIYLAFVEQMIRLAAPAGCAGALVLPLSIACNIGSQFTAARKLIAETRGDWKFAFFDREPHALFGEDVKTRNAILVWSRTPHDKSARIAAGPLRKWRGDSRALMFKSLSFTTVGRDIRAGIPKIDGVRQASALAALLTRWDRLEHAVRRIERQPLVTAISAGDNRTVFVGPTAYNFLNVFLKPPRNFLQKNAVLSEHPLHAITCASKQDALAIFAILSSHLAYWWWHVHGDGFHVSGRFLSKLPFGLNALGEPTGESLSRLGERLWSTICTSPIISLNRGRTSLAFTPNGNDGIRREIDQLLADLAGLQSAFVDELQQFTAHTIAAAVRVHSNSGTHDQEGI